MCTVVSVCYPYVTHSNVFLGTYRPYYQFQRTQPFIGTWTVNNLNHVCALYNLFSHNFQRVSIPSTLQVFSIYNLTQTHVKFTNLLWFPVLGPHSSKPWNQCNPWDCRINQDSRWLQNYSIQITCKKNIHISIDDRHTNGCWLHIAICHHVKRRPYNRIIVITTNK